MVLPILIACEFSGIVRDAFLRNGYNAVSIDLLPSESSGPHIVGDVAEIKWDEWSAMIAFPPCTHLCVSGARWHSGTQRQKLALEFVQLLMNCGLPYCIENPVGAINSHIRKPDQIIQPWQFGHSETKKTCLWLNDLPPLTPTKVMPPPYEARVHREAPGPNRWKDRSRTLLGIAAAMAQQWGPIIFSQSPQPIDDNLVPRP